ncbi:MAG: PAS domain-containing protein [Nitrospirae bacterium]|nr:PAS domain-containing protein [Nitrospirota bacterium]
MTAVKTPIKPNTGSLSECEHQIAFLNHVVNSIPYPMLVINASDFSVKLANSAASGSEVYKNRPCYEIAEKTGIPCLGHEGKCAIQAVKETRAPMIVECLHHDKDDNTLYYRIHAHPILDEKGDVAEIIEYAIDINESKRAEMEMIMFAEKLKISNNDLREFVYIASHDLQEPLRKVTAFGGRLKANYAEAFDEKGRDYLERMMNAAKRMQELINGLLAFSRVITKAQPFITVDLSRVVREVMADLEVRIEQTGGSVEVGDLPAVEADPVQMRQLFQNLISNALKFGKKGRPPVVRVSGTCVQNNQDETSALVTDAERCRIIVEDNGIGFDDKYSERIFGVFQRLHGRQEYEGTGIGLSVCKKIVERHGGAITAKGIPGEGAAFTVTLPVKKSNEAI